MAKPILRKRARNLRRRGESIRDIAKRLSIAKSTISVWCRDIELNLKQVKYLLEHKIKLGQLKGAIAQREKRLKKEKDSEDAGQQRFQTISEDEFFVAGLMLYLAEGTKANRRIDFTNSDLEVIIFMIKWFRYFFHVPTSMFACYILINEGHRTRERLIKNYWSSCLGIPLSQFRKVVFLKSIRKKKYENHDSYYGTMKLRILKSSEIYYRINGLIRGFLLSVVSGKIEKNSRRSSAG